MLYVLSSGTTVSNGNSSHFLVLAFRLADLLVWRLRIEWTDAHPAHPNVSELRTAVPSQPSARELDEALAKFGPHIAGWCEAHAGRQVGDGECWTLAKQAVEVGCGKWAFTGEGYVWGAVVYASDGRGNRAAVRVGDVMQFTLAVYASPTKRASYGAPNHTAVVAAVDGTRVTVWHQNVGGDRTVQLGEVEGELESGEVVVYRAMPVEWVSKQE